MSETPCKTCDGMREVKHLMWIVPCPDCGPSSDKLTDAELDALAEHFSDYVSGPGYDVLRAIAELRAFRRERR